MKIWNLTQALIGLLVLLAFSTAPIAKAMAESKQSKMVLHVSENDPAKMNLALNIVKATSKQYIKRGDKIVMEIVVHANGLHMLRADTSPVRKRIGLLSIEIDNLTFSACATTMGEMKETEGKDILLIPEATVVPGGVLRILALQEQGYSYLKP
ncbi:MAG: DsrE family protein [Alphaproteobacteria bacterium]